MRRSIRIRAALAALVMLLTATLSVYANETTARDPSLVITEELAEILETAGDDELIPVDIWLNEIDTAAVEQSVKKIAQVNRADIQQAAQLEAQLESAVMLSEETAGLSSETAAVLQVEKIDDYIETERQVYSQTQLKASGAFLEDYQEFSAASMSADDDTGTFVSQYAPMITTKLTKSNILRIAGDSRVNAIYYSPPVTLVGETNISIPLVRANYTRDTLGYTGSGIKIGIIDEGLPNRNLSYFTSANIIYDPSVAIVYSDHANLVASVMVAKSTTVGGVTYRGIAPNAKLYATYYNGYGTDWRRGVEWLLSQGVNVINMSARILGVAEGEYGSHERWVDHLAINHSVHFVKSAGNNSDKITSPGMAYNVITVGAINDKNTATHSDDVLYSRSSRNGDANFANKPDLVAPGLLEPALRPHVTAIIAQLLQQKPALKTLQDGMKAILTAGISHSKLSYWSTNGNFDKYGAGLVDARGASYVASAGRYLTSTFAANSAAGSEKTYSFTVSSSDSVIRISLAWLKFNSAASTHTNNVSVEGTLADLDLYVYDPSGNQVASASSVYNNLEVARFVPQKTGTYKIKVKQYKNSNRPVYFGLAWW